MTQEQIDAKAKELVQKFVLEVNPYWLSEKGTVDAAKRCALICIQEIFDADYPGFPSQSEYDKWAAEWAAIKTAIEKM